MKYLITITLLVCINILCHAQATSLTVDNQTPGWLSSKINYGDQLTVENLTLTGYFNGTDFNFITDLSNRRSLHGVLDLSEAHIVAGGEKMDNTSLADDAWSPSIINPKLPFQKVILPKSLKSREYGTVIWANADTIIVPKAFDKRMSLLNYYGETHPFYFIPEGVEQLDNISDIKVLVPETCKKFEYNIRNATLYAPWETPLVEAVYYVYTSDGGIYYYPEGVIYVPNGSKENYKTSDFKKMDIREYGDIELIFDTKSEKVYANESVPLKYEIQGWKDEIGWLDVKSDNDGFECDLDVNQIVFKEAGHYEITLTPRTIVPYFNTIGGTCSFDVLEHATSVEMPSALKIGIGESSKLSAIVQPAGKTLDKVTWKTTDVFIASVDDDGLVKGHSRGSCKIIATSVDGGHTAICDVTVVQPVESVSLSSKDVSLKVGEDRQLDATVYPINADDKSIVWFSADESIAKVSEDGIVTAVAPGNTQILAVSHYNREIKDACEVTVIQPVTGIALDKTQVELIEEESMQLHANVLPENASNKSVLWTSSDMSIAMISQDGMLYAIKPGKATIMATAVDGGFSALCRVVVMENSGIESVIADKTSNVKVYNINGYLIYEGRYSDAKLTPGFYILKSDGKSYKLRIE